MDSPCPCLLQVMRRCFQAGQRGGKCRAVPTGDKGVSGSQRPHVLHGQVSLLEVSVSRRCSGGGHERPWLARLREPPDMMGMQGQGR